MMDASEKDVQVVKVLASASSAAAMTASGDAQTGTARQMMMARVAKKKSFSGTGIRSGSGRTSGGGGGGAKKMAGSKRSAAESGGGGGIVVPNISRDADRAVLRSDGDSEDSESDVSVFKRRHVYNVFANGVFQRDFHSSQEVVSPSRQKRVRCWEKTLYERVLHKLVSYR